jgi:hypothetical protein
MGDNIKMDLQEMGYGLIDWIDLTQDMDSWWALVNTVKKKKLTGSIKCGEFLDYLIAG